MLMKDALNIFQFDWAASPAVNGLKPESFKGKSVLISGHAPARAFAYTILSFNDRINLKAKVILATDADSVIPEAEEREDLTVCEYTRMLSLKQKADIVIHTGLCGTKIDGSPEQFTTETAAVSDAIKYAAEKKARYVALISDSRVYGRPTNKFRSFSETEMSPSGEDDYTAQLVRACESIFVTEAQKARLPALTLRCGVPLGASSGVYNGLEHIFEAVANCREVELYSTMNKLSFTYISDLFGALVFCLDNKKTGVYNIASKDSTASTGGLATVLHDIFGGNAKIKMAEQGSFEGVELNCGKIAFEGFEPTLDLKTSLELSVLSYRDDVPDGFYFPDEHGGRLSALQEVLLAYLIEVDRICKKHNIQWYLGGGTMLGAARHKGFIPWDDDVDIMMLREDYDKFLDVAGDELPEGMILSDPKKDKRYNYAYAKLRLTDTVFATDFSKNHKGMSNGFAFDIFCHDKTANSKIGQKLHSQLTLFWLAMVFNKWNHRRVYNGKKVQSAISNFLKNIFPLRFSMRMLLFTLEMFKHKKNAKYLYDGMGKSVHKGGFDKSFVANPILVDFCGYKLPVPEKYREYLTNHYGDYMELSPLSTRLMGHEITMCDLNKYAEFKISNIKPKE